MGKDAFRGQVVIVTGASAGIGRALVKNLAGQGARVCAVARRAQRLEQLAEECQALDGEVLVVPADVGEESHCKMLVERTVSAFGRLDMLVNNAGMAASALLDEFPDLRLFRQTDEINFHGTVACTYYALPYLKQGKGRLVAVSSLGGKTAIPYNTAYCASKYAVHGFMDALRMELKPHGVSCTVICPWWVATEFHESQLNKDGIPRGRLGRAYYTKRTMTSERCAQITLDAAWKRKREVLMGPGTLAVWLKTLAPGLLDWLTYKVFLEPAMRRARAARVQPGS